MKPGCMRVSVKEGVVTGGVLVSLDSACIYVRAPSAVFQVDAEGDSPFTDAFCALIAAGLPACLNMKASADGVPLSATYDEEAGYLLRVRKSALASVLEKGACGAVGVTREGNLCYGALVASETSPESEEDLIKYLSQVLALGKTLCVRYEAQDGGVTDIAYVGTGMLERAVETGLPVVFSSPSVSDPSGSGQAHKYVLWPATGAAYDRAVKQKAENLFGTCLVSRLACSEFGTVAVFKSGSHVILSEKGLNRLFTGVRLSVPVGDITVKIQPTTDE